MKKLHLNKIFHWLYAFLMFLPFILLVCNVVFMFGKFDPVLPDNSLTVPTDFMSEVFNFSIPFILFRDGALSDVHDGLVDLFGFFVGFDDDATVIDNSIRDIFVYWVEVSLMYLVFDVVMYLINLAHHWIDKGSDRL